LAYLSGGHTSANPVVEKRAIRAAAIVATVKTNPNLRISLTSQAA
jgi:nicotinate-nucleotide pyrophosphorylase